MLNHPFDSSELVMNPGGSLNSLLVPLKNLHVNDPLLTETLASGKDLVSRHAVIKLLQHINHPRKSSLRDFLTHFDSTHHQDKLLLELFGQRFHCVLQAARNNPKWMEGTEFQQQLAQHWQAMNTLVISGGLTSHQFGIQLAEYIESQQQAFEVIASPWGGVTALFGLSQTVAQEAPLLVMDLGATGIKRGIAYKYGNRIELLPDLKVANFKTDGLIRKAGIQAVLKDSYALVNRPLNVAISIACYLNNGHPVNYRSGIYHRLVDDCSHLTTELHQQWLPQAGFAGLSLIEHDSTSAALAFKFKQPAMMVTLGTGLGSAACPRL